MRFLFSGRFLSSPLGWSHPVFSPSPLLFTRKQANEQTNEGTNTRFVKMSNERTRGLTNRRTRKQGHNGQTNRRSYTRTNQHTLTNRQMNSQTHEQTNEQANAWTSKQPKIHQTDKQTNRHASMQTNEPASEYACPSSLHSIRICSAPLCLPCFTAGDTLLFPALFLVNLGVVAGIPRTCHCGPRKGVKTWCNRAVFTVSMP